MLRRKNEDAIGKAVLDVANCMCMAASIDVDVDVEVVDCACNTKYNVLGLI